MHEARIEKFTISEKDYFISVSVAAGMFRASRDSTPYQRKYESLLANAGRGNLTIYRLCSLAKDYAAQAPSIDVISRSSHLAPRVDMDIREL